MPRLLFLDYDDTILSQPHHAVQAVCRILGKDCPSEAAFKSRRSIHFYEAFPEVFRSSKEMWAIALLAVPLGYFRSQMPLDYAISDMAEVLHDHRTYVLSKNPPAFTPWRVRRLRAIFKINIRDRYIACGPLLKRGPSKTEIIKKTAAYHHVELADCLLVDDSDENVLDAAKNGIKCALVNSAWNEAQDLPSSVRRIAAQEIPSIAKAHLGDHELERDQVFIAPPMGLLGFARLLWGRLTRKVVYGERLVRQSFTYKLARSAWTSPFFRDPHQATNQRLQQLCSSPSNLHGARLVAPDGHENFAMVPLYLQNIASTCASEDKIRLLKIGCRDALERRGQRLVKSSLYLFTALDREKERQRVLASSRVHEAVVAYAKAHNTSTDEALQKAREYAVEIVAGRTYLGCLITMTVFNLLIRTFKGLSVQNSDVVKGLERDHFVIFAAVHRSYLDSAVLLACIANLTNSFPFVAAADKMRRVWSGRLGYFAGAFFIQRKFVNTVYAAILTEHVSAMQVPGQCLEIFLEGQRSRTGLTLPPKKGIASIIWNNIEKGDPRKKTVIVPVAFTYNKLPESELLLAEGHDERRKSGVATLRELADISIRVRSPKKGLDRLRATLRRFTSAPISECYVSYGQPIFLTRTRDGNEELEQHLHRTMRRINAVTQALPSSILCLALLNAQDHHLTAIHASEFLDLAKVILPAYGKHEDVHPRLYSSSTASQLEEFVRLPFVNRKFKRRQIVERNILALSDLDVERASYYMNNIMHFFVLPALLASVLVESQIGRVEELHRFLDHMFAKLTGRYFLPEVDSREFIDQMLETFQGRNFIARSGDSYSVAFESEDSGPLALLARLGRDLVKDDLAESFGAFRRSYQRYDVSVEVRLLKVKRQEKKSGTLNPTDGRHFLLTGEHALQVGDDVVFVPEGEPGVLDGKVTELGIDGTLIAADSGWLESLRKTQVIPTNVMYSGTYSFERGLNALARVESISTSGALVITDVSLNQSDVVSMSLKLGATTINVEGQVMRASGAGAGVKFNRLSMEQEAKLLQFLANLTSISESRERMQEVAEDPVNNLSTSLVGSAAQNPESTA